MAHKKPVGWRKEPGRHSLAAKGVKTTMKDIRSGRARRELGLDTSSDSRYTYLRKLGYSDEDAQAMLFGVIGEGSDVVNMRAFAMRSLGILAQKAQENPMSMMTGPRIAEAARHVKDKKYDRAIGMLKEVAKLGPSEVTRRANEAIKDIQRLKG